MEKTIQRAIINAEHDEIQRVDLVFEGREPSPIPVAGDLKARLAAVTEASVTAAMRESGNNQSEAARRLGIERNTLRKYLKSFNRFPEGDE